MTSITTETMRSGDYVYTGNRYYERTDTSYGAGTHQRTLNLQTNLPVGSTFSVTVTTNEIYVDERFTVGTSKTYDSNNVYIYYAGGSSVYVRYIAVDSDDYMGVTLEYLQYVGLSCKAYSKTKSSYAAIPSTIEFTYDDYLKTVCPVTSLEGCFENCRLTSAPTIPSGITNMTRCFYGCSRLTGNITVNNTPTAYTNAFGNTSKDIFILNNGGNVWQTIAGSYSNVHYEADDNPAPSVTAFTVTRVSGSGQTEYSARGEWAHIQITVNVSTAAIPIGWTNSLKSVTLKKDGTVITPTWTPSSPTSFPAVMETWVNTGDLGTHSFSIQIADSIKNNGTEVRSTSSAELTISLLKVYTLVDYYHDQTTGTEGIAFGKYAENADLFEVDMPTKFVQSVKLGNTLISDFFRPVGSTFETVDKDFDPNTVWGGTWELLPEGTIILAGSESGTYKVGADTSTGSGYKEYGENSHTLTVAEMPSHQHNSVVQNYGVALTGFPPSGSAVGVFRGTSANKTSAEGGGQAHNIMQKSIAMYIWIRTA